MSSLVNLVVGRRAKYGVLLFWLVVVALAAPLAQRLTGAEKNDSKSWLPGAAESTRVLDRQAAFRSPNTFTAVVVYDRPAGLTPSDRSKIVSDAGSLARAGTLGGQVVGPAFSPDGQAAQVAIPLDLGHNGWSKASKVVGDMKAIAGTRPGLVVHVTGPAGYASDSSNAFKGIDGTLLYSALAVVIVILLLTYRSPLLWLLPAISAGVALMSAQGVIYLLAAHAGLVVNAQSAGILTVLVFGASTDYALLLVARYREELRRCEDRHDAMATALRRAGPAIVASAGTVTVGLLCLLVAETNSTRGLGPVAAIGVAIGLLSMITLLPAMLVTANRWIFWPVRPRYGSAEPTSTGWWARIGVLIGRRPRRVWLITVLALAAASSGMLGLHASGLTSSQSFRGHPDSVIGEQVLSRHFAAGVGSPLVVVSRASGAPEVTSALTSTPGVASVAPPVVRGGEAYIQATLRSAPDSRAAFATVDLARAAVHPIPGADALVGGDPAINLDVQRAAKHDRDVIIPVILAVVLAILGLLLRALVAPIVLIATVVLSFAAALGLSAVAFDHVFGFGGADTALPLFVFVFLVALGVDYNIFLMTRVREEALARGTRSGAVTALGATGGVITSAGFVLAGTFAVLATLPVTSFAEIGFAVALGVLLDTLVVRSVLVTALNLDIGDAMWWPGRLWRRDGSAGGGGHEPGGSAAGSSPALSRSRRA